MLKCLFLVTFMIILHAQSIQNVSWSLSPFIKSGQSNVYGFTGKSLLNNGVYTYIQAFNRTFNKKAIIALTIYSFSTSSPTSDMGMNFKIINTTNTLFSVNATICTSSTYTSLILMYFAIDSSFNGIYVTYHQKIGNNNWSLGIGNGYRTYTQNFSAPYNYIIQNQNIVLGFISGFYIQTNGDNYNLSLSVSIGSFNTISATYSTGGNTIVNNISFHCISFDNTSLTSSQIYFINYNSVYTINSGTPNFPNLPPSLYINYYNYMMGLSQFSIYSNQSINLTISPGSQTKFDSINFLFIYFLQRTCPNTNLYYLMSTQSCYSYCPLTGYYQNTTYFFCTPCVYTCNFCGSNTSICLTCPSTRTLVNTTCICISGFYQNNKTNCAQICGDGIVYTLPCDDSNNVNGDGCSSNCTVQTNYICNDNLNGISICNYIGNFTLSLLSLVKNEYSNQIDLILTISPNITTLLPVNFSSSIFTDIKLLQNTSIIATYWTNSSANLYLKLLYNQNCQMMLKTLLLNLSSSPTFIYTNLTSIQFIVSSDNNLPILYYQKSSYFYAQSTVISWKIIYAIGLALFILNIFIGPFVFSQYITLLQFSFVGIGIIQKLPLFLVPIRNLKWIIGYNLDYINIGDLTAPLSTIGFHSIFIQNFNLMFISLIFPLIIGFSLGLIRRIYEKQNIISYVNLIKIQNMMFFQLGLAMLYLNLFNLSISFNTFLIYSSINAPYFIIDLFLILFLLIFIAVYFTLIIKMPLQKKIQLGLYFQTFNPFDFSTYYSLLCFEKVLMGSLIVIAKFNKYIVLGIPVFSIFILLYTIIYKPYSNLSQNIKVVINQLVLFLVIGIYCYYELIPNKNLLQIDFTFYLPLIELGVLYLMLIYNIGVWLWININRLKQRKVFSNDQQKQVKVVEQKQQQINTGLTKYKKKLFEEQQFKKRKNYYQKSYFSQRLLAKYSPKNKSKYQQQIDAL